LFESITITLAAHKKVNVGAVFSGKLLEGTNINGWSSDIGIEIEVAE